MKVLQLEYENECHQDDNLLTTTKKGCQVQHSNVITFPVSNSKSNAPKLQKSTAGLKFSNP